MCAQVYAICKHANVCVYVPVHVRMGVDLVNMRLFIILFLQHLQGEVRGEEEKLYKVSVTIMVFIPMCWCVIMHWNVDHIMLGWQHHCTHI